MDGGRRTDDGRGTMVDGWAGWSRLSETLQAPEIATNTKNKGESS